MVSLLRAKSPRILAGLTLALLLAGPFVLGTVHDEHEGQRCPVCKLGQTPVLGIALVAEAAPPLLAEPLATPTVLGTSRSGALRAFAPRGPPA